MKFAGVILLAITITLPEVRAELFLVDKIECVVCGPIRNTPLTHSDETKLDMNGQRIAMQQQIQFEIVDQQIVEDKIPIDPTAKDKYVETLKKQNNLTDMDLADLFEPLGRTLTEGLALLGQQYNHEMYMHHTFKSQQIATDEDVKKYYDEHPKYSDGYCEIQVAYVDFDAESKDLVRRALDKYITEKNPEIVTIEWSSPIKVALKDIADDKKFIFDMNPGQMVVAEDNGVFELYKLLEKEEPRLKSLEELRSTIVDRLNREKMEGLLEEYNQQVRKFIDVIDLSNQ